MPEPVQEKIARPKAKRNLGVKLLLVAVILECVAAYSIPSVKDAVTLATSHQPEPITELYFSNPNQLAKTYKKGQGINVNFTIHNVTGTDVEYPYAVYQNDKRVSAGIVHVPSNATNQIGLTTAIAGSDARTKITIKLLDINQSIHFWTEKEQ